MNQSEIITIVDDGNKNILAQRFGDQRRWVNWQLEEKDGKLDKIPKMSNGQGNAKPNDPSTWSTFAEVDATRNRFSGVGIMLDNKILGIDLDHCIVDGEVSPEVAAFIERARTYVEISPSRTGLHAYLELTEPMTLKRNRASRGIGTDYEVYTTGRWFTYSANPWKESYALRTVTPAEAFDLLGLLGYPWKKDLPPQNKSKNDPVEVVSLTDEELLKKMFESKNGVKIRSIYYGDMSAYGNDDSSADMALCAYLAFWTAKNRNQMERIWLASPLGSRKKTQERKDYRNRTIDASIMGCKEVYAWEKKQVQDVGIMESAEAIRKRSSFTHIGDLLNEPDEEISWIVDELLPSSGFSVLAAKPKVGKSTLARQLALSVSQGEIFLGRQTTKGAVLYVALEEKRGEVRKHFKLLGAMGSEDLHVHAESAPEKAHQWLKTEIKNRKPVLVIIDTLFRFVTVRNGNDYAEVTAALSPVLALARENGVHLMVIHHAGKGGRDGGDSILGSTAIFGSVDTAIILKRTESKRTIETQQRYGANIEPTVLVFDEATQTTSLGGTKENDDIQRVADEILTFLFDQKESCTEKTIEDAVDGRTGLKRKALRDLVAKGSVNHTGAGRRNDPYLYSCSLVPHIYTGREKQETKSTEDPDSSNIISCSQDSPILAEPEQENTLSKTKVDLYVAGHLVREYDRQGVVAKKQGLDLSEPSGNVVIGVSKKLDDK
ncbi:MAG: AAA family ATPase [bacterium]|nr:AAA family ATPase [bacterium]